jgi:hypothetical protein
MDASEVMKRGPIPNRQVTSWTMTLSCRLSATVMMTFQGVNWVELSLMGF